jgi:hypothetical protein
VDGTAGLTLEAADTGLVVEVLMFEIVVGGEKKWKRNRSRRPRMSSWACATPTMPLSGEFDERFQLLRATLNHKWKTNDDPTKNPKAFARPWGSSISLWMHEPYGLLPVSNKPGNNNRRSRLMKTLDRRLRKLSIGFRLRATLDDKAEAVKLATAPM